jgi:hypothetical protein
MSAKQMFNSICEKIFTVKQFIDQTKMLNDCDVSFEETYSKQINAESDKLQKIENKHDKISAPVLEEKPQQYFLLIKAHDITRQLSIIYMSSANIYNKLISQVKSMNLNASDSRVIKNISKICTDLATKYRSIDVTNTLDVKHINIIKQCENCQSEVQLNSELGKVVCVSCGAMVALVGEVFDDITDKQNKQPVNNHNKPEYGSDWLLKMQGLESYEPPENIIKALKARKRELTMHNSQVTYAIIREWLKVLKIKGCNEHVVKLHWKVTGIAPEKYTTDETLKIIDLLRRFCSVHENLSEQENFSNCSYYPQFVLKAVELIVPRKTLAEKRRFARLISAIYLQKLATVEKNDMLWKKATETLGVKFISTNYALYKQYINNGGAL